jgi:hypothetical protein
VRDLQTVYELQLEREITARREYELGVEARVREEVGADVSELAALRAELTVLRQSLQCLFDGDLPMHRPALRADATRIQELTSAVADPAKDSSADAGDRASAATQQPRSSVTPVFVADHPEPPLFASPFDDPVTAETAVVPMEPDTTDDRHSEPLQAPTGWADAFTEVLPATEEPVATEEPPAPMQPQPTPQPQARPTPQPWPTTSAPGTPSSRRRRRVDPDADSGNSARRLSVAEIMANLQSEENGRGGR